MKFRMLLSALLLAAGLVFVAGCGKKAAKKTEEKKVDDKQAAIAVFNEWKTAIAKGDFAKARELTTAEPGKEANFDKGWNEWVADFKAKPALAKSYATLEVEKCDVKPVQEKEYPNISAVADMKLKKGGKIDCVFMLKIDGKWKVMDIK